MVEPAERQVHKFFGFSVPIEPGEGERENPGKSGVCLSGAQRSEFSRVPDFPERANGPGGRGLWGAVSWSFFGQAKKDEKLVSGWSRVGI